MKICRGAKSSLTFYRSYGIIGIGTYCTICGKLDNLIIPHDILEGEYGAGYRSLTKEEIRVRYSHLPHFTIENWYKTKYVNLEN